MTKLLRAYRQTIYEAGGCIARVGRRSRDIDALLQRLGGPTGAFVTAWNPFSRRHHPGWNDRMQGSLAAAGRRLRHATGHGTGTGWHEAHFLFVGDLRRLRVLARRFRQAAIVELRQGAPARLVLLRGRR